MSYKIILLSLLCATWAFSLSDPYEPNNDFASAFAVTVGDSVVTNAIVGIQGDTGNIDLDFYKVTLVGGMQVLFSTFRSPLDLDTANSSIEISLYDASKNIIVSKAVSLNFNVPQSGVYYCRISNFHVASYTYGLSIRPSDCGLVLLSPNGGERFRAGQIVTIKWTRCEQISSVGVSYSCDNGKTWLSGNIRGLGGEYSDSCQWVVPSLKNQTDVALIQIFGLNMPNPPEDVSNSSFTILASPPDAYEPNNDFASAYPISIGDSVVKNAIVIGNGLPFTAAESNPYADKDPNAKSDFFKVHLIAGTKLNVTTFPWKVGTMEDSLYSMPLFTVYLYDTTFRTWLTSASSSLTFPIPHSGDYYLAVTSFVTMWFRYGMSINTTTILSSQGLQVDTNNFQKIGDDYKTHMNSDSTKLSIDLTFSNKVQGSLRTMVLLPGDLLTAPNTQTAIKAISIDADSAILLSMKKADIVIPYTLSDINGFTQNSLSVLYLDDSANQWIPVDCTIDSVNHKIVAHTSHFSIYGVFAKSGTPVVSGKEKVATAFGMKTNYVPQQHSIVMNLSLPNAGKAELRLYDIQGKCVRISGFAANAGSSTHLWNLENLAKGKYFVNMRTGSYYSKGSILIMN